MLLPRLGRLAIALARLPRRRLGRWAGRSRTSIGVDVDEQFTVFGSGGAITVAALTLVLPYALNRNKETTR